jgi:hypothetical protein
MEWKEGPDSVAAYSPLNIEGRHAMFLSHASHTREATGRVVKTRRVPHIPRVGPACRHVPAYTTSHAQPLAGQPGLRPPAASEAITKAGIRACETPAQSCY